MRNPVKRNPVTRDDDVREQAAVRTDRENDRAQCRGGGARTLAPILAPLLAMAWVLGSWALVPSPASAHAALVESNPTQGQRLDSAPTEVSFSFNEDIAAPAFVVITAAGERVEQGSPVIEGGTVTQAITADAPAGAWTMAYRVISTDGHPVTGEIPFRVAEQADSAPVPEESAPADAAGTDAAAPDAEVSGQQQSEAARTAAAEEAGLWSRHGEHVLVGAGLLALAGVVLVLARRRST